MAKLEIVKFPNPLLKKESQEVQEVTSKITDFVQDLFDTMYGTGNGIGLAAPQVGENLNIFVMDIGKPDPLKPAKDDEEPELLPDPIAMINPKIVKHEGIITYEEGCLSCPELLVSIDRAKNIVVDSLDAEGRPQTLTLSDLAAVCTQHEMDHLKGKLLTDYISRLKRDRYRKQRIRERKDDDDVGDI